MSGTKRTLVFGTMAAVLLGGVGLLVGYFAPLSLNPDATLGPLLGLFFTGPVWMALGFAVGALAGANGLSRIRFALTLLIMSIVATASTLYMSLPEDRYQGLIIEGEIVDCKPAAMFVSEAISRWGEVPKKETWWTPRVGWREDLSRMLRIEKGVVLTLNVVRKREVYVQRKPWNSGIRRATPWDRQEHAEKYFARFAGDTCAGYGLSKMDFYSPEWEASTVSPPDILPTFLGLYVLEEVPAEFQSFVQR